MLTIRLQRTGTKNKPAFRLVLAQAERSASKKFLEVLGYYNPRSKDFGIKDESRLKYWIDQNVKLSPTVNNLLVEKKLITTPKVKAWTAKKKEAVPTAETAPATTPKAETPSETPAAKPSPTETPAA